MAKMYDDCIWHFATLERALVTKTEQERRARRWFAFRSFAKPCFEQATLYHGVWIFQ